MDPEPDGLLGDLQPVLARGRTPVLEHIVYRSTFAYDAAEDALTFWYSGARYDGVRYVWGAAVERRRRADVFAPGTEPVRTDFLSPAPAPLTDWP